MDTGAVGVAALSSTEPTLDPMTAGLADGTGGLVDETVAAEEFVKLDSPTLELIVDVATAI